jgi:ethanolamine kinase
MSETRIFRGVARELARWHATLPTAKVKDANEVLNCKQRVWSTAKKWLDAISKHPNRSKAEIDDLHEKFQYLADNLLPTDLSEPVRYWGQLCVYCSIVGLEPYFYLFSNDLSKRLLQC